MEDFREDATASTSPATPILFTYPPSEGNPWGMSFRHREIIQLDGQSTVTTVVFSSVHCVHYSWDLKKMF